MQEYRDICASNRNKIQTNIGRFEKQKIIKWNLIEADANFFREQKKSHAWLQYKLVLASWMLLYLKRILELKWINLSMTQQCVMAPKSANRNCFHITRHNWSTIFAQVKPHLNAMSYSALSLSESYTSWNRCKEGLWAGNKDFKKKLIRLFSLDNR